MTNFGVVVIMCILWYYGICLLTMCKGNGKYYTQCTCVYFFLNDQLAAYGMLML